MIDLKCWQVKISLLQAVHLLNTKLYTVLLRCLFLCLVIQRAVTQ